MFFIIILLIIYHISQWLSRIHYHKQVEYYQLSLYLLTIFKKFKLWRVIQQHINRTLTSKLVYTNYKKDTVGQNTIYDHIV